MISSNAIGKTIYGFIIKETKIKDVDSQDVIIRRLQHQFAIVDVDMNKDTVDDNNSPLDISNTVVVVNTDPWCDDVEFIVFLQNERARAVDANFSTSITLTSTTIALTIGTYLITSVILYIKNLTTITTREMDTIMSGNSRFIIIEAYVELIDGYNFRSKLNNDNDHTMEAKFGCKSLSPTLSPTPKLTADNYTDILAIGDTTN